MIPSQRKAARKEPTPEPEPRKKSVEPDNDESKTPGRKPRRKRKKLYFSHKKHGETSKRRRQVLERQMYCARVYNDEYTG